MIAAAVIYVTNSDPNAFAFAGVDLVQILYIVFDVTIKSKGQIIFHIIYNWILSYKINWEMGVYLNTFFNHFFVFLHNFTLWISL